uniref:Protein kinase domain-containing protein n=1 Tax=Neogobius melanostomus TaxID=47308 RepID=A0A8C6WE02_9GOBI
MLRGRTATYSVVRFLGEGFFGMVVEVRMLERIGELDSDRCNVVSFKERFDHMGLTCLVFEMLDISLWDLVIDQKRVLVTREIRPIAQQLLVAFDALKDISVIHSDLKPDNVMLTNRRLDPYRVKLIDFGLARPIAEVEQGMIMQPDAYRAPEVTLGCVCDVPIDMYGLGCTLAFLLLEQNLFPRSEYQSVKMMVDLLGIPPSVCGLPQRAADCRPQTQTDPKQALQHAFITMTHLTEDSD